MLFVPSSGPVLTESNTGTVADNAPNFSGTLVTTGAGTSATKGAVAQLIASTLFDAYWVTVIAGSYGLAAAASEGCLDILIGAATEDVLIADLLMGYCGGEVAAAGGGPKIWNFPLHVPAGSRLSAKACGARLSTAFKVAIYLYGGNGYPTFPCGQKVTTYGVTAPTGTLITPGASGVEGAYAQIVAATSGDHIAVVPSFQVEADITTNNKCLVSDIGVGAATEEEIASQHIWTTDANEHMGGPWNAMPCFRDIPSGTRLAFRASNSAGNDGQYGAALHCVSA